MISNDFSETLSNARRRLMDACTPGGHWVGELSSSALSTATAVLALHQRLEASPALERKQASILQRLINDGLGWLALHQNSDGGWGDTVLSLSNISTTALCWATFSADAPGEAAGYRHVVAAAEAWLTRRAGGVDPARLVPAIVARYGRDKTFSVPILTACALAGRLGEGKSAWGHVPRLPFELAALPPRWFKWMKLPVVSYALPALIAIGMVRHVRGPGWNPVARSARALARRRALKLLNRIQPTGGGFLEATPLTSFVLMSLAGAGEADHPVVGRGVEFLVRSVRDDGSWPIDTNLSTWVTTLAIEALGDETGEDPGPGADVREWLLGQQYRSEHPYTLADAGGWAWTDLPGGVPDADDTSGALLALRRLSIADNQNGSAAIAGLRWLLGLQNRDGGIPTFCRGWGNLPFDRSSADITAHAMRAWAAWRAELPASLQDAANKATERAAEFLMASQRSDGAWTPLWFGNQFAAGDENPTYGTARVLAAAAALPPGAGRAASWASAIDRGARWLLSAQNPDGGWGAGAGTRSSIEETALAVDALARMGTAGDAVLGEGRKEGTAGRAPTPSSRREDTAGRAPTPAPTHEGTAGRAPTTSPHEGTGGRAPTPASPREGTAGRAPALPGGGAAAIEAGVEWLVRATEGGNRFDPSPIGFYFAKLWYFEQLYPIIFTVAALTSVQRLLPRQEELGSLLPS